MINIPDEIRITKRPSPAQVIAEHSDRPTITVKDPRLKLVGFFPLFMSENPNGEAKPWANHIIRGLKNPQFLERKVGDLSLVELQAIEVNWLPKVHAVWDTVKQSSKDDAQAFEAAIAYYKAGNPNNNKNRYPEPIPERIRARLKRLSPYVGNFVPDKVRQNAKDLCPVPSGWEWDDGSGDYQCELELCDLDDDYTIDPAGYVAIQPLEDGKYALIFVVDGDLPNFVFRTIHEAKAFLDNLLAVSSPNLPIP